MQTVTFTTPRGSLVTLTADGRGAIEIDINGTRVENPSAGGLELPVFPDLGQTVWCKVGGKPTYLQVPADRIAAVKSLRDGRFHALPAVRPTSFDIEDADECFLHGGRR